MAILFMLHNCRLDYAVKGMQAFHVEQELILFLKKNMSVRHPNAEFYVGEKTLLGRNHCIGWKLEKYVCMRFPDNQIKYVGTFDDQTFVDLAPEEALEKSLEAYRYWAEEYNRF